MRAFLAALIVCAGFAASAQAEQASYYGRESGPRTASGERFNPNVMTAAMCSLRGCGAPRAEWLPFGTMARITFDGRSVVVRINDRGPFIKGRDIDLSEGAARQIGLIGPGHGDVQIEVLR